MPIGMLIGYFIVKKSGTSSICINRTGRRTDFGAISAKSNGNESVHRSRTLSGTGNGAGAYRHFDFVVSASRIRSSPWINIFVPKIFTAIAFDSGGVAS